MSGMLVGRTAELERLHRLVAALGAGGGGAVLLGGDAGIGKSALLNATARGCEVGTTVLRASGVQSETDIAFSGLSDLLAPLVDRLDVLPEPQAAALAAALALAPPRPGDRLAVSVATLGLLRAAGPLLAVVDDLQWLDPPSRECVLYAARRAGDGVGIVLAARRVVAAPAGVEALRLDPLSVESARELLMATAPDLAAGVARTVVDAAAGNPLALIELPGTLSAGQRTGRDDLDEPLTPGDRLHDVFAGRVGELGGPARRVLLLAAAHVGDDLATIAAADVDVAALQAAEAIGLVRIGALTVTFTHPLIRGAVYQQATPPERRAAHRALAGALVGERRAWHLAAAAVGPDEEAAAELETVGGMAAARRGFASATTALERAARLSPDHAVAARRLLGAGETAAAAGLFERAAAVLAEAAGPGADPVTYDRAMLVRGQVMLVTHPVDAVELLVRHADGLVATDPVAAAAVYADASTGCTVLGDCRRASTLAERAATALGAGGDEPGRARVLASLGWARTLCGRLRDAVPALDEAEGLSAAVDPLSPAAAALLISLNVRLPSGDLEGALANGNAIAHRARTAGAVGALAIPLMMVADAAYRLGDWPACAAACDEGVEVALECAQPVHQGMIRMIRGRLLAAQGATEPSLRDLRVAIEINAAVGARSGLTFGHAALGFLALGLGRIGEAVAALREAEREAIDCGLEEPSLIPWQADLVEAYARAGRAADAYTVLAVLERQAHATGTRYASSAAARCRGILDDDFGPAFVDALAHDDRRPMPFERARTQLAFGRRLHRARRRAQAREHLREALAGFEQLGAQPWAAQTRVELRAAGGRRRRAGPDDSLTAQQARVAEAVARGASNQEIAAELYLAPKTVESHLRQIYRKLGVRSRAQLVATLARRVG